MDSCGCVHAQTYGPRFIEGTNGDGCAVAYCYYCGVCYSAGRYWEDKAVGRRFFAERELISRWSSLQTRRRRQ